MNVIPVVVKYCKLNEFKGMWILKLTSNEKLNSA